MTNIGTMTQMTINSSPPSSSKRSPRLTPLRSSSTTGSDTSVIITSIKNSTFMSKLIDRYILYPWWQLHCDFPSIIDGNTMDKVSIYKYYF